jgi:hypothetical protein
MTIRRIIADLIHFFRPPRSLPLDLNPPPIHSRDIYWEQWARDVMAFNDAQFSDFVVSAFHGRENVPGYSYGPGNTVLDRLARAGGPQVEARIETEIARLFCSF